MTKKDYEMIASAIVEAKAHTEYLIDDHEKVYPIDFISLVNNICNRLEADNPRFDRGKFLDAVT